MTHLELGLVPFSTDKLPPVVSGRVMHAIKQLMPFSTSFKTNVFGSFVQAFKASRYVGLHRLNS